MSEQSVYVEVTGPATWMNVNEQGNTKVAQKREKTISVEGEFTDPKKFHQFVWNKKPKRMAEFLLDDKYQYRPVGQWHVNNVDINAATATEWASVIANEENVPTIDVLVRWLQNLPSMRIRRAVDSELKNAGFEVEANKI